MITLNKLSKSFGSKVLFEEVTMSFNPGNRYGLTGPNGCGKSTLLRIMKGDEEATTGSVTLPEKVGILKQNIDEFKERTVLQTVIMGNRRLFDALEQRDALYEVEMTDEVGMKLGELEGIIAEEDGYSSESDAEILLSGIGIDPSYNNRLLKEIPTDLQFRALICQALFGNPQALLLDEPTNHLDLESITWLEEFLQKFSGTVIVISHDRYFLNSVTTHIADIDYETIIIYPGNYDDMVLAKTDARNREIQEVKSKEKKIAQLQEFVSKFGAGTRASQVQSRKKEMDKLKPQELKQTNIQRPYIRFQSPEKLSGKIPLKAVKLSKSFGDLEVIKNFSLEIERGDKIAVIGNNGRGKTTLLKLLAGKFEPDKGRVELGHQAIIDYFPQNHGEIVDKQANISSFDWIKQTQNNTFEQDVRGAMGKLLFSGDDAFKAVNKLSGGETARLILAKMMLFSHNVLIMDEPNNHLDLEAVSALAWSLNDYKGTVIFASHDRDLIETVATKIISFSDKGIEIYNGPMEEFLEAKRVSQKKI